jgi:hypothetical protein
MSVDISGKTSKTETTTDWNRLRAMTDDEVHKAVLSDPDIKPADEDFWREADVVMPNPKETISIVRDGA